MTPKDLRNHVSASCGYTEHSKAVGQALDLILNKAEIVEDNQARLTRGIPVEALDQMEREGWATVSEQAEYWRIRDKDLDRIESASQFYDQQGKERAFDGEDVEEWQRLSDEQGTE